MTVHKKTAKSDKPLKKTFVSVPPDKEGGMPQEVKEVVAKVIVESKDGAETTTPEAVGTVHGPGPFANVGIVATRTFNLGNFESVKVSISLHVPCLVTEEEIEGTYAFCSGWVDAKMADIIESVKTESS
jgi:hypothetical protein